MKVGQRWSLASVVVAVPGSPLCSPVTPEGFPLSTHVYQYSTASGRVTWFNNTHLRLVLAPLARPITCGINLIADRSGKHAHNVVDLGGSYGVLLYSRRILQFLKRQP